MSGIAQSVLSDWKYRPNGSLSIENLKKLADALEVPITYFLED
jgi:transcriptional regulator with XRE-family HTH domain